MGMFVANGDGLSKVAETFGLIPEMGREGGMNMILTPIRFIFVKYSQSCKVQEGSCSLNKCWVDACMLFLR